MTLKFVKDNIFSSKAEAIVNTVNCVGIMGKGLALEFKKRWPNNYKVYKRVCNEQKLQPGVLLTVENDQLFSNGNPKYLINFPTKKHWREKSKLNYIEAGLDALILEIKKYNIGSIAIPQLGCGNGGLNWNDVKPMIENKLSNLSNIEIEIYVSDDVIIEPEHSISEFKMTYPRAVLLKTLGDLETHFSEGFDRISLQKIVYFLQVIGVAFNLDFSKDIHGPYSIELEKAFLTFEKYNMITGFTGLDELTKVTTGGFSQAESYLNEYDQIEEADVIIKKINHFIEGYESAYGLELLSSIHRLTSFEKRASIEHILNEMLQWPADKRSSFDENTIKHAFDRLKIDGFIAV